MKTFKTPGELTVLVGKDARENDKLLAEAKCNDLWFHSNDGAGPHVILQCNHLKDIPEADIRFAAQLAIKGKGDVMYCYVGDVIKPKRVPAGTVFVLNEKIIKI